MPAKNVIKTYLEDTYYHLYNRGVNKAPIFFDDQDYKTFLSYLKDYLSPPELNKSPSKIGNNFYQDISLHAYCLMPNHFHLLIHQQSATGINFFMRSFNTRYVRYINTKYQRVGALYQCSYKAVRVITDEQLLYLTKYIHRNPLSPSRRNLEDNTSMFNYSYSSLQNYLGNIHQFWLDPSPVLAYFPQENRPQAYRNFVTEDSLSDEVDSLLIDKEA